MIRRIIYSPLGIPIIITFRLYLGLKHIAKESLKVAKWFVTSKETTNFTYETTRLNKLSKNAIILGDNCSANDNLLKFSIKEKRKFYFFIEEAKNHVSDGCSIGVSIRG